MCLEKRERGCAIHFSERPICIIEWYHPIMTPAEFLWLNIIVVDVEMFHDIAFRAIYQFVNKSVNWAWHKVTTLSICYRTKNLTFCSSCEPWSRTKKLLSIFTSFLYVYAARGLMTFLFHNRPWNIKISFVFISLPGDQLLRLNCSLSVLVAAYWGMESGAIWSLSRTGNAQKFVSYRDEGKSVRNSDE